MSPQPYRRSPRRITWAAFLRRTCFGSSSSSVYSSFSSDSLPLLSEKISFSPTVQQPPKEKPLPASPPRLTRWPSASNLKARRSVLNISDHKTTTTPQQNERSAASFTPKTRSRSVSTPETELPALSSLGAVGGVGGVSYADAAMGKEDDIELRPRGGEGVRFGITVENDEPRQKVMRERGGDHVEEQEKDFV